MAPVIERKDMLLQRLRERLAQEDLDLIDLQGLGKDALFTILGSLGFNPIDRVKAQKSLAPGKTSSYCQTEDISSEMLSLDEKLRRIDHNALEQKDMDRAAPFKSLE